MKCTDTGCRVLGFGALGLRCGVQGLGFSVQVVGFRVKGSGSGIFDIKDLVLRTRGLWVLRD